MIQCVMAKARQRRGENISIPIQVVFSLLIASLLSVEGSVIKMKPALTLNDTTVSLNA